jgi:heme-degrading monooxygenase HmoA
MVEFVCEFVVKEEARGQFELAYGPGGAWSKLFGRCPGFRGTTVLRDTRNPRRYLTVDLWETGFQQEQALAESEAEYADLQTSLSEWIESKTEMGVFGVLVEAVAACESRVINAQVVNEMLKKVLEKRAFDNWHGITQSNLDQHLVQPFVVNVDPDSLPVKCR